MEEYYETMPEETQQEEGDYPTLEEIQSAPPPVEQPAPVLQAVTTLATGVESKGPVDYIKHLDEVYRQIAPKIQEQEKQFAMEGAKLGDVNYVGSIVQDMYKRQGEMNAEKANHIQRFRDVASVAFDNVVFNNTGIIYNNTPEQIAKSAERTINTVTVASTMERLQKESTLAGMAGSFALAFTPLGITTNVALGSAAEKYIGEASSKVNYGKTIDELRYFYTTLGSESEKVSFIQTFQKELENTWSLTKYDSVNILNEIVTEPEGISTVGNIFYSSAPLLGAIPIVGQVSKSAKLLSAASKLSKTAKAENIVAGVGGKDSIVEAAASAMRQKAVLGLASEVTGVQSAIDITNLATKGTSAVLGKMLPDAITTASGKVQEAILESVEKANQKLRSTIGLQNVRESEIEDLIKSQMVKYDKNIDKTLHMVHIGRTENDPLGVLTTVLRGTQDGTVFLTKEAVDEYIKVADPSGKLGLKAVKDTANNTHALTVESKRALILERDAAMAKIAEMQLPEAKIIDNVSTEINKINYASFEDADAYKKGTKDISFKEAVSYYNNKFPQFTKDAKYQKALEFLQKNLPDDFIVTNKAKQPRGVSALGYYRADTNKIYMATKAESDTGTLIHEGMHALTLHRLDAGLANKSSELGKKVAEFDKLRLHVKKFIKDAPQEVQWKAKYLTKNIYEFGVGAFDFGHKTENADIAKWMESIKYKNTTVLSRFFDLFKSVLGISKKDTALSQWFGLSEDILSRPVNVNLGGKTIKREAVFFGETVSDNTEAISKLQATVDLSNARLKAASDIENGLSAGWLVEEKIKANLNASSLGKFKEEDIQSMMRFAFGDKALGASKEVYEAHLLGVMAESRIRGVLVDMVEKPIRALNRKDRIALNNALVAGDKEGKVFDAVELRGMDLVSDESQKAYYAVRAARDMTWRLRNQAASKSMTLKGWKEMWHPAIAKYKDELQGFKLFGKEADTSAIGKRALDPNTGETMVISANRLEELNNRGFKIVEFDTPVPMAGVNRTHVIVQAGGLELKTITEVIPYRTGEMSRIYDDEYFVRLKGSKELDGLKEDVNITHRTAKSAREANAYAKAYNEMVALYKEGKLDTQAAAKMQAYGWKPEDLIASIAQNPRVEAVVNYTRTDDDYLETLTSYGRSFTSKRGEHIPDVFGNTTNVVDPLDALASEIGNTAYMASHTEWFDVSIQRWFETAKPFLSPEMQKMTADKAFARYVTTKGSYVGQDKTELFVRRVADQIAEAMKVNDKESRQMLGLMKSLTESFEAKTGKFENVGSFMRQTNWESFAKTFAFHCVFAFNPVQLFVQGANTVNAIAISPLHGLKAAKTYTFLRAALTSDNPDVWAKIAKTNKWASVGMESEEDFIRLVKAVDRSGLVENLQTSSLYNMQLGKHNLTKGFLSGDLGRASSFFFREGEEASRLVAFDISRREWIKANPGKVWDTDEALKEILVRQDMLTGTMTNANTAWWQKGLISIPAQFLQFPVKFGLNIVNSLFGGKRTFTQKEALSLIIGNLTLFGTAGLLGTSLAQSVFGDSIGELSEDQRLALSQGVIASAVSAVTSAFDEEGEGAQLAIGDRINPLKFYVDFVKGLGNLEEAKALEMIGGPFFGMMQRVGLAGSQIKDLYVVNPDLSPEKASEAIKALVKITSVGNNYFQGVRAENLYNQHVSKGVGQYRFNDKELFYQKYFGIKPAAAVDFQSITESNIDYAKRMKKEAERITDLRIKALEAYRAGDTTTGEKYGNMVNILLSSMPINDRAEVESKTRTIDASTKLDEMLVEHMLERSGTSKKSTMVINQP
jgi:hypothetical protein